MTTSSSVERVSFVVTGFGPFGEDVLENPTTILADHIKEYCQRHQLIATLESVTDNDDNDDVDDVEVDAQQQPTTKRRAVSLASLITTTLVLETSAQAVRDQMNALHRHLLVVDNNDDCVVVVQDGEAGEEETSGFAVTRSNHSNATPRSNNSGDSIVILLHLGVNSKGECFQLEQCAYNDASFRIPDEQGYQPNEQCIFQHYSLGKSLTTPLDLTDCIQQLQRNMSGFGGDENGQSDAVVEKSTDPGRFVCNYLYFYSLCIFCPPSSFIGTGTMNVKESKPEPIAGDTDKVATIPFVSENDAAKNDTDATGGHETITISAANTNAAGGTVASEDYSSRQKDYGLNRPKRRVYPLFVHVPPFAIQPEESQLEFISQLMKCLYQQVTRS